MNRYQHRPVPARFAKIHAKSSICISCDDVFPLQISVLMLEVASKALKTDGAFVVFNLFQHLLTCFRTWNSRSVHRNTIAPFLSSSS